MKRILLAAVAAMSLSVAAAGGAPNPARTQRLHESKWGVFTHFLAASNETAASWNARVDAVDVEKVADQLKACGAGFYFLTISQCSRFQCAPNATFDRIAGTKPGEACSRRDLPREMADAMHRRGIDFYLYFTGDGPASDKEISRRFGCDRIEEIGVTPDFVAKWSSVLEEYACRYGKDVRGWWFDGMYPKFRYTDELMVPFHRAVLKGNPDALVAMNKGVQASNYDVNYSREDFTAGEFNDFRVIPRKRFVGSAQAFTLIPLGASPGGREWDSWSASGCKRDAAFVADYVSLVNRAGGVVAIDVKLNDDGSFEPDQFAVLKAVGLKTGTLAAGAPSDSASAGPAELPHRLWYRTAAPDSLEGWERESLPLGCGHFGVSVFGGARHERLQVTHNAVLTSGNLTSALDIRLDFPGAATNGYSRGLDLERGLAWVTTGDGKEALRREYFTSYPARALAMRLTAAERGALTFRVRAENPYPAPFLAEGGKGALGRRGTLVAKGDAIAADQELERYGVRFAGRLRVVPEGGTLVADGDALVVSNADAAVVYFACDTNYRLEPRTFTLKVGETLDRNDNPGPRADALVAAAQAKGWAALKAEHERDLAGLLSRASICLGADAADLDVPTDVLLADYAKGRRSRYLEETYWQFGRYLLVASSRPGTLPANLQGVWTAHQVSPWGAGYWHNINVQMNYWPAFNSNLAECFRAYADFNAAFRPVTRPAAIRYLREHGLGPIPAEGEAPDLWSVGTAVYPYALAGAPGGHSGPGTGGLTTKVFADWYDFTLEREALEKYVWPVHHGMAEFLTRCVVETNGLFLSGFSASPEQMVGKLEDHFRWGVDKPQYYTTVGCAFDQQMIWENNHDLLRFADLLGKDDALVRLVRRQIGKYDPVQVGASGQIKEFREENAYGEIGQRHHRHISQLCGLMPGTLITRKTPEWLAAAKKTLDFRGDESTGWALAHRLNARARTGEGDRAYRLLGNLLAKRTHPNLWDVHPPFQIDGNFGATAGITEMLVQSHADGIDVLPALPQAWAKEGSFRGLCARGAYEVDCAWRDGAPTKIVVRSLKGRPKPEVRFNGKAVTSFDFQGPCAKPRDTVLVVEAHAGDCADCLGTLVLLKDRGWNVRFLDMTAPVDEALAAKRASERVAACAKLGATGRCLGYREGDFYAELETSRALVKILEDMKPTVVLTHWPLDTDTDHVTAAGLVMKALNFAPSCRGRTQLHFFEIPGSSRNFEPDAYVYMNQVRDRKESVAACFTETPCRRAAKKFPGFGHPQLGCYPPRDVEKPTTIRGLEVWTPARNAEAFASFDPFRWGGTPVGRERLPFYVDLSQAVPAE